MNEERPDPTTPDDPLAAAEPQTGAAADLVRQRDEMEDLLRRTQAEFVNYQKRAKAQADIDRQYAIGGLALDLLAVLDNLDRALDAARQAGADSMVGGLELVRKQFHQVLAKHGVEPIEALGQPFDPNFHEALLRVPQPAGPEGVVVNELSRGYRIRDRVLRPSGVAVSTSS